MKCIASWALPKVKIKKDRSLPHCPSHPLFGPQSNTTSSAHSVDETHGPHEESLRQGLLSLFLKSVVELVSFPLLKVLFVIAQSSKVDNSARDFQRMFEFVEKIFKTCRVGVRI